MASGYQGPGVIGHGTTAIFYVPDKASPTYTSSWEVDSVTPFAHERASVETTHLESTGGWREHIGGLLDAGGGTLNVKFDPTETSPINKATGQFQVTYPDGGTSHLCDAFCTNFTPAEITAGGLMTAQVVLKLTGVPTEDLTP